MRRAINVPVVLVAVASVSMAAPAMAEEREEQQTLFVIESAYVQSRGEWQVGASLGLEPQDDVHLTLDLELEYGLSDRLQVQIEAPFVDSAGGDGPGDVSVGFSYALLTESEATPQMRLSIGAVLPTGDTDKGLGADAVGMEISTAASKQLAPGFFGHVGLAYERMDNANDGGVEVDVREWEAGVGFGFMLRPATTLTVEVVRLREESRAPGGEEIDYATEAALGLVFRVREGVEIGVAARHLVEEGEAYTSGIVQAVMEW